MINTFQLTTHSGEYFGNLPFLTSEEHEEFNSIGYSGKTINGEKTNYQDYLNSLNKGEFQVTQIKFDSGDFTEKFIIVWVD